METPASEEVARLLAVDETGSLSGQSIGPYKVLKKLGAGGMGEVYLAHHTRTNRKVALKLLPAFHAKDRERVERFEQEARAVLALNHPNIVTIYDIEQAGDASIIASEFIEGETIRQRVAHTPFTVAEALDVAIQVAGALAAAHRAGIVHRDLKPENIMLRPDGYVKVLDFGLAKLTRRGGLTADSGAPTEQIKTHPGMVLGTVNYMSPEQARGLPVDERTDIFSFGVVLYEMLAGRRPFQGETAEDTIASILRDEPPALPASVLAELAAVVNRALRKSRDERYQTVAEMAADLRGASNVSESPTERRGRAALAPGAVGAGAEQAAADLLGAAGARHTSPTSFVRHLGRRRAFVVTVLALVAVLLGAAVAVSYFGARGPHGGEAIDSLAVLPFTNVGGDPEAEYFSDGITESLINSLSRLPGIRVMSRNSVFRFKGREADVPSVARSLKVRAVLTGRVVQRGDELIVSVELTDAADNTHVWGAQYNRKMSDVFAVQQEIAREISERLRVRLSGEDARRLAESTTDNPEAYRLYLKGRHFWNKRTAEAFERAREHFQRAIDAEPDFALAHAGLADVYNALATYGVMPASEAMPRSKAAALRALELDPTLAEAHASLASVYFDYEWNWERAFAEYERAIELNPNYATAHHWYGDALAQLGRFDEGLAANRKAQELDPLSLIISRDVGLTLYLAGRYDEAVEQARNTLEMDADFAPARHTLASAYLMKGMHGEALAEFQRLLEGDADAREALAGTGYVYAVTGRSAQALQVIGQLKALASPGNEGFYQIAMVYAGLGETDEAFRWLERSYARRDLPITSLKVEPLFAPLRADPRFKSLLTRIGN